MVLIFRKFLNIHIGASMLSTHDVSSRNDLDALFDKTLKSLHSKNARKIYEIFYANRAFDHITTHDIETQLAKEGLVFNKKEINGWLVSLQDSGLILKLEERGRPVASEYQDKYTFDLWKLSEIGLRIGQRLPTLMDMKRGTAIPKLDELTPSLIDDLEDLYLTSKILVTLNAYGGSMSYLDLRKKLYVDSEKLAVYTWPDSAHSEKPLFEVKVKPPTFKGRVYKLFGWLKEQDLIFTLTEEGKRLAAEIVTRETTS